MPLDNDLLSILLDSLKDPFVFCDTNHYIRYWNAAASAKFEGRTAGPGDSILDCHDEGPRAQIALIAERFKTEPDLDEVLITDDEEHRIFMRAVRDSSGKFLGYYERYEPPVAKA